MPPDAQLAAARVRFGPSVVHYELQQPPRLRSGTRARARTVRSLYPVGASAASWWRLEHAMACASRRSCGAGSRACWRMMEEGACTLHVVAARASCESAIFRNFTSCSAYTHRLKGPVWPGLSVAGTITYCTPDSATNPRITCQAKHAAQRIAACTLMLWFLQHR